MKKFFTLFLAGTSFALATNAQPLLVENFDFTGNLSDNGWIAHSGVGTTPIATTTGLTYADYAGSAIGNGASMSGTGEDVHKEFAAQTTDGSVFLTALVNVTEANATTGMYFLHLGNKTSTTPTSFANFTSRVFVKTDAATGVNFGVAISAGDANGVYGATTFAKNTTYLLIVKYMISTTGNDSMALWVRSAGVPNTEVLLGTPEIAVGGSQPNSDGINAVGLRQNANLPDLIVDGIRIATNYNDAVIMPLNLTSFTGSLAEGRVKLNWTSANETNVENFTIERSKDGIGYAALASVEATNKPVASYNYIDISPVSGVNYYRLVMRDKDGTAKYSNVVVINNRKEIKLQVFPNPTTDKITVSHDKANTAATIRIMSAQGQEVKTFTVQPGAIQTGISVNELIRGNYLLIFENNGEKSISKFVKQ